MRTRMAPLLTRMARMARLLTRMARMLTRMAHMLTRMTRWLAGSHIIHTLMERLISTTIVTEVLFHPLSLCWVLWRITIKKLSITKTLHDKIINLQYAVKPLVSNHPNAKIFWLHTHCMGGGYWWESNHRSLFQEKVLRHLRFWTVDGLWELVT